MLPRLLAPELAGPSTCLRADSSTRLRVYSYSLHFPYEFGSLKLTLIGKCFVLLRSYDRLVLSVGTAEPLSAVNDNRLSLLKLKNLIVHECSNRVFRPRPLLLFQLKFIRHWIFIHDSYPERAYIYISHLYASIPILAIKVTHNQRHYLVDSYYYIIGGPRLPSVTS